MAGLHIWGVSGLPEIEPGTDLADAIASASDALGQPICDGDVVLVTSKIVSKAEGRTVEIADIEPSAFARSWSAQWDKDPAVTEVVLRESKRIVRQLGATLITDTQHGFVCANSGVEQSSSGAHGRLVLLPIDSDASARTIRRGLQRRGINAAVVVTDTFGRAWRNGQTDIAIGVAGINPMVSYIGQVDPHGHEFKVQLICAVDELAGAGELVKGNVSRVPAAVVRGFDFEFDDEATIASVPRDQTWDMFR